MTRAQFDAARYPLLNPGPIDDAHIRALHAAQDDAPAEDWAEAITTLQNYPTKREHP